MNTNEWHQWQPSGPLSAQRPNYRPPYGAPKPHGFTPDTTLNEKYITVERKIFKVSLKENLRGRFLRISEHSATQRTCIIIPETGLEDLLTVLVEMVETCKKNPPSAPASE